MAKNLVEIIVTAEDKASGVLKGIGGAMKTLGGMAVAGGAVAVTALAGVSAGIVALASHAAPIAGVKDAFEALTSTMQGGSAAMLAALQDASGGLITNTDLMTSFNLAASLVSKDFAEQLPDAMSYLSKVAAATGQDMNYMLDSLVKGVGRLSPMILDNLGIQVNLTEANEAYAQSIGKSVDELTKAEQQTALMNQVLEKLAANTEGMEGLSNPFAQFKVTLANLKDEIGLRLLPVVAPLMEKFGELAQQAIPILVGKIQGLIDKFAPLGAAVVGFISNLQEGMSPLNAFIEAIWDIAPQGLLDKLVNFRDNILPGLIAKFTAIKDAIVAFITPIAQTIIQFEHWGDVIVAFAAAFAAFTIVTTVISKFLALKAALAALGAAISSAGGVVAFITGLLGGPLTIVLGIVAAAIGLLTIAWRNNWGDIQGKVAAAWDFIQPILQMIGEWVGEKVRADIERLRAFWVDYAWPAIQAIVAAVWPVIQAIFQAIGNFITGTLIPIIQALYQKWVTDVWPKIQTITQNVWTVIKAIFEELGRWINTNIVPWIDFLKQKWDEDWARIRAALDAAWQFIKPIWEQLKEWMGAVLPPVINALKGYFDTAMSGIRAAIQPVLDLWNNLVGAVQSFWNWITGKVFSINISIPDLPSWATPGSPLPIHTAWKAFAADMDKIGRQLGGGFDMGLGNVGMDAALAPAGVGGGAPLVESRRPSVVINIGTIDARGAARGVETDIRRAMDGVMRDYGRTADARIRTGG